MYCSDYVRRLIPLVWSVKRVGWVAVSSLVTDRFSSSLDGASSFYTVSEVQFVAVWYCVLVIRIMFSVSCSVPENDGSGRVLDFILVYLSKLALFRVGWWCAKMRWYISLEIISKIQNTSLKNITSEEAVNQRWVTFYEWEAGAWEAQSKSPVSFKNFLI